jgi:orotate phosphoribosyltransferase
MHHESLALGLFEAGCVQFGRFKLKSGLISPIYLDLRLLVSDPATLWQTAGALAEIIRGLPGQDGRPTRPLLIFDRIAAIPYAALPIGVALSLTIDRPVIYPRKEVKTYGTARAIEGRFQAGEKALLLDDLITRADSKLETAALLEEAGLQVQDILVVVDREQGGAEILAEQGYHLHSLLTLRELLEILAQHEAITARQHAEVLDYLEAQRSG